MTRNIKHWEIRELCNYYKYSQSKADSSLPKSSKCWICQQFLKSQYESKPCRIVCGKVVDRPPQRSKMEIFAIIVSGYYCKALFLIYVGILLLSWKSRKLGKVRYCDNERSYLYIVILIESQFLDVNFSKRLVVLEAGRFKST